ncbi:neutral zinc metallopeptidase [Kribbella sp. NPDC023972]|uniref:neutral zinc metallopeptidase n=1 Tax=Kribbella sp. NPDC023972 TaxID=3154795 RepID=UPI0033F0AD7C
MADKPAPKPGHFLPGGAGADGSENGGSTPGSSPLSAPTPRLGADTPAGPPQLSGSRIEPGRSLQLSGTRFGPPPPDDPAAAAFRAVYAPEPIPFVPKQRAKALIASVVVAVLLVVGGGVALGAKLLPSFDDFVADPLGTPSYHPSGVPEPTPTAKPTPDLVVQKENPLYTTGPLATVKCQEPAYRPTSKENVRSYYQALIACMDKAWAPLVTEAGFEFRSPRLIVFDEGEETACGIQKEVSSYCADEQGGSVTMPWQKLTEEYPEHKATSRVDMAQSLGFAYGAHLQNLAGIFDATKNLRDTEPTEAARLEMDRRQALQANCLSAAFFGAVKASFPLRGELLSQWTLLIRRSGDEHTTDKIRDHGSAKSLALWMNQGFASTDPGTCNTFVAASAKVG